MSLTSVMTLFSWPRVAVRTMPGKSMIVRSGTDGARTVTTMLSDEKPDDEPLVSASVACAGTRALGTSASGGVAAIRRAKIAGPHHPASSSSGSSTFVLGGPRNVRVAPRGGVAAIRRAKDASRRLRGVRFPPGRVAFSIARVSSFGELTSAASASAAPPAPPRWTRSVPRHGVPSSVRFIVSWHGHRVTRPVPRGNGTPLSASRTDDLPDDWSPMTAI